MENDSNVNKVGRPKGKKNLNYTDNKTIGIRLDSQTLEILIDIANHNSTTVNKIVVSFVKDYLRDHY